jgi:hypothetical protein
LKLKNTRGNTDDKGDSAAQEHLLAEYIIIWGAGSVDELPANPKLCCAIRIMLVMTLVTQKLYVVKDESNP